MINKFISHVHFGIIIMVLYLFEFRRSDNNTVCGCSIVKALKMANCSGFYQFHGSPPNCGKFIKALDLSGVEFIITNGFNGRTFENYTNLVNLYMRGVKFNSVCTGTGKYPTSCPAQFNADVFNPLKLLEVLDLSGTTLIFAKSMKWPPKLRILHLTNSKINEIPSMATLGHFSEFNAANNKFKTLPEFKTEDSVINYIELVDNPLDDFNVSQIAPFCELRYLGIRVSEGGKFARPEKFCKCIRLQKWMKKKEISGVEYLACNSAGGKFKENSCRLDLTFSAELELYEGCLDKSAGTSLLELLIYAALFSILFPVLYFVSEIYNNYYGRASKSAAKKSAKRASSIRKRNRSSIADHNESDSFADGDGSSESIQHEDH